MNKKLKRVLNIILSIALVICAVMAIRSATEGAENRKENEEASMLAAGHVTDPSEETTQAADPTGETAPSEAAPPETRPIPEDPIIHELMQTDLEALRAENEDVVGWITIPDTVISYPLLQWTDNEFYLEHTWKQTKNINGAIFIEAQNSPDFTDFNTIIYGHNMTTGAMFGSLKYYKREAYWQQHPSFYIVSDEGVLRYDIFAVHKVNTQTIVYGLDLETDQQRTAFLRFARDYSSLNTGIEPTVDDKIVTLSTCTGQGHASRWVVQGVLNESGSYRFEN